MKSYLAFIPVLSLSLNLASASNPDDLAKKSAPQIMPPIETIQPFKAPFNRMLGSTKYEGGNTPLEATAAKDYYSKFYSSQNHAWYETLFGVDDKSETLLNFNPDTPDKTFPGSIVNIRFINGHTVRQSIDLDSKGQVQGIWNSRGSFHKNTEIREVRGIVMGDIRTYRYLRYEQSNIVAENIACEKESPKRSIRIELNAKKNRIQIFLNNKLVRSMSPKEAFNKASNILVPFQLISSSPHKTHSLVSIFQNIGVLAGAGGPTNKDPILEMATNCVQSSFLSGEKNAPKNLAENFKSTPIETDASNVDEEIAEKLILNPDGSKGSFDLNFAAPAK